MKLSAIKKPDFPLNGAIILILSLLYQGLSSQTLSQSPYARFGLGDRHSSFAPQFSALGGASFAFNDSVSLNLHNPAALTSNRNVVFECGMAGVTTLFQGPLSNTSGRTAGYSYFALALPLTKWLTSAISLAPESSAGFSIRDSLQDAFAGKIINTYSGRGSISSLALSNGIRISNSLSAGLSVRYLFGAVKYESFTTLPELNNARNSLNRTSYRLNDLDYTLGFLYTKRFHQRKIGKNVNDSIIRKTKLVKDSLILQVGAAFSPMNPMSASLDYFAASFFQDGSSLNNFSDTISNIENQKGIIRIPQRIGGGITLRKSSGKWALTTNVLYTDWNSFRVFDRVDSLRSGYRVSAGLQLIPKPESILKSEYLKRVRYRFGAYYSDGTLRYRNTVLTEMGVSIGFGLPVKRPRYSTRPKDALNMINIGLEAGQRGTSTETVLRERFIRLTIGFSLNDDWFNKRQYD